MSRLDAVNQVRRIMTKTAPVLLVLLRLAYGAQTNAQQESRCVPSLDLVVVTTADNFLGDFTDNSWNTEGAIFRMIARDVIPAAY